MPRTSAAPAAASLSLIARQTIRASAERLFQAWTRPELLTQWWGPENVVCPEAQVDLRVGGGYRIANRFPDGRLVWIVGEFEQVVPPHRLVYTWRLEPAAETAQESRVTVRFEARDEATEVIVVHERLVDAAYREHTEQGWHGCLARLAALFEPG